MNLKAVDNILDDLAILASKKVDSEYFEHIKASLKDNLSALRASIKEYFDSYAVQVMLRQCKDLSLFLSSITKEYTTNYLSKTIQN